MLARVGSFSAGLRFVFLVLSVIILLYSHNCIVKYGMTVCSNWNTFSNLAGMRVEKSNGFGYAAAGNLLNHTFHAYTLRRKTRKPGDSLSPGLNPPG